MNLSLNADVQRFIEEKVRAGQYATPEDVIHTAIARLRTDEALGDHELDDEGLAAIEEGLAQANRGEGRPWDEVREELRAKYLSK
jgi:Arc/MetJ-type ribon-helix-helix transcriptional regulator